MRQKISTSYACHPQDNFARNYCHQLLSEKLSDYVRRHNFTPLSLIQYGGYCDIKSRITHIIAYQYVEDE